MHVLMPNGLTATCLGLPVAVNPITQYKCSHDEYSLDSDNENFKKMLKVVQSHCYTYIVECLKQNAGGRCCNGRNTFIQKWDMPECNTNIDSVWIQVYTKGRRAYYAHEDCFKRSHIAFEELRFVTDDYTKTRYVVLKECGETVLESI